MLHPQLKTEESDGLFRRTSDVFTSDNPFQSGSSPAAAEQTPSNRRRTTSHNVSRSTSKGTRRRTDDYKRTDDYDFPDDDDPAPYGGLEVPTPRFTRGKTPEPHYETPEPFTVEAGEEFTPQEQLELATEEVANSRTAVMRADHGPPLEQDEQENAYLDVPNDHASSLRRLVSSRKDCRRLLRRGADSQLDSF